VVFDVLKPRSVDDVRDRGYALSREFRVVVACPVVVVYGELAEVVIECRKGDGGVETIAESEGIDAAKIVFEQRANEVDDVYRVNPSSQQMAYLQEVPGFPSLQIRT
jgi:hypothetical protein